MGRGVCPAERVQRAGTGATQYTTLPGLFLSVYAPPQLSVCDEMLQELRGIVTCRDSLQLRRRRGPGGAPRTRPLLPEEPGRLRAVTSLSNGMVCGAGAAAGVPEALAHRLAQEAALVARSCGHARICPECRRFQGLRARVAGAAGASPTHSEGSFEWEKTIDVGEPE